MELMFLPDNNIENITNSINTTAVTAYMKNLIGRYKSKQIKKKTKAIINSRKNNKLNRKRDITMVYDLDKQLIKCI